MAQHIAIGVGACFPFVSNKLKEAVAEIVEVAGCVGSSLRTEEGSSYSPAAVTLIQWSAETLEKLGRPQAIITLEGVDTEQDAIYAQHICEKHGIADSRMLDLADVWPHMPRCSVYLVQIPIVAGPAFTILFWPSGPKAKALEIFVKVSQALAA